MGGRAWCVCLCLPVVCTGDCAVTQCHVTNQSSLKEGEMVVCCPAHRLCGSGIQAGSKGRLVYFYNAWGFTWETQMAGGDLDTQELRLSGGPGWSGTRAGSDSSKRTGVQSPLFVVPGFTKTRWELPGLSHLVPRNVRVTSFFFF